MGKFLVLEGKHQVFEHGERGTVTGTVTYPAGKVVESKKDLCKIFNRPGCPKFRRVSESVPRGSTVSLEETEDPETTDTLDSTGEEVLSEDVEVTDAFSGLTIADLRGIAEEEEIDLAGATKKKDILKALREHTGG